MMGIAAFFLVLAAYGTVFLLATLMALILWKASKNKLSFIFGTQSGFALGFVTASAFVTLVWLVIT